MTVQVQIPRRRGACGFRHHQSVFWPWRRSRTLRTRWPEHCLEETSVPDSRAVGVSAVLTLTFCPGAPTPAIHGPALPCPQGKHCQRGRTRCRGQGPWVVLFSEVAFCELWPPSLVICFQEMLTLTLPPPPAPKHPTPELGWPLVTPRCPDAGPTAGRVHIRVEEGGRERGPPSEHPSWSGVLLGHQVPLPPPSGPHPSSSSICKEGDWFSGVR